MLWREKTGRSMAIYSETHWWSRWKLLKQVMQYFGDIEPFLLENDVSPSYRRKLLAILHDPEMKSFLEVELAVVIDVGEQFVKGTYQLEGDGPLVFSCFEVLRFCALLMHLYEVLICPTQCPLLRGLLVCQFLLILKFFRIG